MTDQPQEPRETPEHRFERLVFHLCQSVRRWTLGFLIAALTLGFMLKRRFCWGTLVGTLAGFGSFHLLVATVMRMKGSTGAMFGAALLVSLFKFGLMLGGLLGLWYLGVDLLELLGGVLASQFAIVAGCARSPQFRRQDDHARA